MRFIVTYVSSIDEDTVGLDDYATREEAVAALDTRIASSTPHEGWSFPRTDEGYAVVNRHGWVLGTYSVREGEPVE